MSAGRGSAVQVMIMATVLLCLLVHLEHVHAATYTVGDSGGWTYNTASWPKGKRFRAGDVLVFSYDSTSHNVVAVDRNGYKTCTAPAGAQVYTSGNDKVKLVKGQNYFICGSSGHCSSGMKLAIIAV